MIIYLSFLFSFSRVSFFPCISNSCLLSMTFSSNNSFLVLYFLLMVPVLFSPAAAAGPTWLAHCCSCRPAASALVFSSLICSSRDPLHGHRQKVHQLELPRRLLTLAHLVHGDQRVVDVLLLVGAADMFVVEVRGVLVVCLSPVLFVTTFSWWASYQPSKES